MFGKNNRRLSSYWLDPDFQGKMLLLFGSIGVFQAVLAFFSFRLIFSEMRNLVESFGLATPPEALDRLDQLQSYGLMFVVVVFVFTSLFTIYIAFRFSHDAVGAIHRVKLDLNRMTEKGEIGYIKLRESDFFQDLVKTFNQMVDKIK